MSMLANPPESTTFLLLKPCEETPTITNTSDPAGDAFNRTLRQVASLHPFYSQLFGWRDTAVPSGLVPSAGTDIQKEGDLVWDAKYFGWRKPGGFEQRELGAEGGTDALVWVINWESLPTLTLQAELLELLQEMAPYFELPEIAAGNEKKLSSSQIFSVQWEEGGPKRILNRTLRPVELTVSSSGTDRVVQSVSKEDQNLAAGYLMQEDSSDDQAAIKVILRSVPLELNNVDAVDDVDMGQDVLFRTSLTRTRWCTKIKEDLMASITSRRFE